MANSFGTFEEEKAFYRKNESGLGCAWGDETVDSDIASFIALINDLPFTFSKGMSCSGSFRNHHMVVSVPVDRIVGCEKFKEVLSGKKTLEVEMFRFCHSGNNERFGRNVYDAQGYAVMRVLTTHARWPTLQEHLRSVPHSLLLPIEQGDREHIFDDDMTPNCGTFTYQVFYPYGGVEPFPEDASYLSRVWSGLVEKIRQMDV